MSIGVHTMLSMVWTKTLSQAEGMQEVYGDTWLHIPEQPDCPLYRGRTSIHIAFQKQTTLQNHILTHYFYETMIRSSEKNAWITSNFALNMHKK